MNIMLNTEVYSASEPIVGSLARRSTRETMATSHSTVFFNKTSSSKTPGTIAKSHL